MDPAQQALASAALYTDEVNYALIHLPAPAITAAAGVLAEIGEPFSALVVDKDEVTLVLPEEDWQGFKARLPDYRAAGPFRLITFDLPLALDLVGFLALVSRALADASVTVLAFSAFERDHLLVPASQLEQAVAALREAQARAAQP
jgi:hypothetical protein